MPQLWNQKAVCSQHTHSTQCRAQGLKATFQASRSTAVGSGHVQSKCLNGPERKWLIKETEPHTEEYIYRERRENHTVFSFHASLTLSSAGRNHRERSSAPFLQRRISSPLHDSPPPLPHHILSIATPTSDPKSQHLPNNQLSRLLLPIPAL